MNDFNSIADNLKRVRENIENAAQKSGSVHKVKLVAVSKGIPAGKIREVLAAGHHLFGENYLQEAVKKMEQLSDISKIEWHFIGGLQTNKAKHCIQKFSMIQTVDRGDLALILEEEARKRNIGNYPILVQVNFAGEGSKSGVSPEELSGLIYKISNLECIKIKGLMVMPPYSENPENSRIYFIKLREFKDKILSQKIDGVEMVELSMGMSHDYIVAVQEGATIVRVGTAIFGKRG